jgi:AraC-like DNA-binding protein
MAPVFYGRQYRSGYTVLPRHRHSESYLALVLSGGYEEAGDRGRYSAKAGDIVLHGGFEAHVNRYGSRGAEVFNLKLPTSIEPFDVLMQVPDADELVRTAERDAVEAVAMVLATMKPVQRSFADWPDELAAALQRDPHLRLQEWARHYGLADATVSRGFQRVFGITPSAYRAQVRARSAWRLATATDRSLSEVAAETGFYDQAHMTRTVIGVTGSTPGVWRRKVK